MVQRRVSFLTHTILVLLIILILFPVVWVVSTSIRRDEAAFSTKLFTSRVSLQNYIDLLAPEKNVPVLVQELQSIVSRVKPYDKITQKRAEELIEKYIKRLEYYFEETQRRHDLAKKSYMVVTSKMLENSEKIKANVVENLEELKKTVENNLPNILIDESYALILYETLQRERYDSSTFKILKEDLEKYLGHEINDEETYEEVLSKLREIYATKIGIYVEELNEYDKRLSQLNFIVTELRKRISEIQNEVVAANLFLKEAILPELKSLSHTLESFVELKTKIYSTEVSSPFPIDDSKMLASAEQLRIQTLSVLENLQVYADYKEFSEALVNIEKGLQEILNRDESIKKKVQYNQIVGIYEELRPRIERVLAQIGDILENTGEKILILKNMNEELAEAQKDIENNLAVKANLQEQIKRIRESTIEYKRFVELKIFKAQLEERIATVKNIKSLSSADLTRYSAVLNFIRNFANAYEPRDQISSRLSKTLDSMRWVEEYRDFVRRFENTSKNLDSVLSNAKSLLNDFKMTYSGLLAISFAGNFVRSDVLTKLSDLISMDFVNKVKADMTVTTRRAGNLMDRSPLDFLESEYKNIDKYFYRIDNIWKQKPKHYFLYWVLNSVIVATVVGVITTAVCAVAAYPFSRMRFKWRRYGLLSFLLIQMFPAVIFMIAIYNLLNFLGRYVSFLGIDTLGGLIFSYLTGIAYNMYLMKGFYDTIPPSLEEAAIVDGATRFQSFYKIILPLARPILVVVFLLVFIGTFNEFVVARIILQNVRNYTYALGLQTFAVGPYETEWGLFTAAALLGMMPMVILFLSMQRFLVSGLTRGAVKE